ASYSCWPPMTNSSPSAGVRGSASASSGEWTTSTPSARKPRSRVTTTLRRPGSGRPSDSKVLRPMTTVWPMVVSRKNRMSSRSRHGMRPPRPMTPFLLRATIMCTRRREGVPRPSSGAGCAAPSRPARSPPVIPRLRLSYRDLAFDVRVRIVIFNDDVLVAEVVDGPHVPGEAQRGQGPGLPGQLQLHLLDVVAVNVHVAESVDELAGLKPRHVGDHHRQQRVAGDVERHAQEKVARALVQLARQPPVRHV